MQQCTNFVRTRTHMPSTITGSGWNRSEYLSTYAFRFHTHFLSLTFSPFEGIRGSAFIPTKGAPRPLLVHCFSHAVIASGFINRGRWTEFWYTYIPSPPAH